MSIGPCKHGERLSGSPFLHQDRRKKHIQRAGRKEALRDIAQQLRHSHVAPLTPLLVAAVEMMEAKLLAAEPSYPGDAHPEEHAERWKAAMREAISTKPVTRNLVIQMAKRLLNKEKKMVATATDKNRKSGSTSPGDDE